MASDTASYTKSPSTGGVAAVNVSVAQGESKGDANFGWDYQLLPVVGGQSAGG